MASLLERKLIVLTGKGGTGKSTVACALGLIAARRGLRTIVVEVGDQQHIPDLFVGDEPVADGEPGAEEDSLLEYSRRPSSDRHPPHHRHGDELGLQENLWSTSVDPDRALIEWLQTLTGRISARLLASSSTFQYFAAAAPGAKELVSMIKVRQLCEGRDQHKNASEDTPRDDRHRSHRYDLVVLDAPATGHALAMLRSPQTFATIVRIGPLAEQASRVQELLEDRRLSGYVAVAHATEMAVTETLELEEGLRRGLDRDLDVVVVNGTMPRRFTREEMRRIAQIDDPQLDVARAAESPDARPANHHHASAASQDSSPGDRARATSNDAGMLRSAAQTALAIHERARMQQSQIARLRRQRFADGMPPGVVTIPFTFTRHLNLSHVREIATQLERKL